MIAMQHAILGAGSDGPVFSSHSKGYLGTCHYGPSTSDKSRPEVMSKRYSDSEVAVVSSARLDNRGELAELLGVRGALLENATDNELILLSYRRWGKDCAAHLLGDFVFAIWDESENSLILARDHVGIKPFFFYRDGRRIFFSSEYRALFDNKYVPKEISDEAVARYLRFGDLYDSRLTFVSAIKKLPPATIMTESFEGTSEAVYWRPEDAETVEYETTEEYRNKLRELLQSAIQARLSDATVLGTHLSGGLDSSTITAIAATQLSDQQHNLHAFTWFPPSSVNEESDEGLGIARRLAENLDFKLHCTAFEASDMYGLLISHNLAGHDTVDLWYEHLVRVRASSLGVSTILSGWGGDELITNYGAMRYIETFWRGEVISTLRDMYSSTRGKDLRWLHFLKISFAELLVRPLSILVTRYRKPMINRDYLGAATQSLTQIANDLPAASPSEPMSVREYQLAKYRSGHLVNRLESWAVAGQGAGIAYRYPLLDKRIIEFALGIPARLYHSRGVPRFIFRLASKDIVPEEIWQHALKDEHNRVQVLFDEMSIALENWRELDAATVKENKYIDINKIAVLVDEFLAAPRNMSANSVYRLLTLYKSIMVLNLRLP